MEAYCQSVAWCHWEKKGGVQIRTGSTVESVDLTRSPIFVHESEWITVIIISLLSLLSLSSLLSFQPFCFMRGFLSVRLQSSEHFILKGGQRGVVGPLGGRGGPGPSHRLALLKVEECVAWNWVGLGRTAPGGALVIIIIFIFIILILIITPHSVGFCSALHTRRRCGINSLI